MVLNLHYWQAASRSDVYVTRAVIEDRISGSFFITLLHKETRMNFERRNDENVQKRNFT